MGIFEISIKSEISRKSKKSKCGSGKLEKELGLEKISRHTRKPYLLGCAIVLMWFFACLGLVVAILVSGNFYKVQNFL